MSQKLSLAIVILVLCIGCANEGSQTNQTSSIDFDQDQGSTNENDSEENAPPPADAEDDPCADSLGSSIANVEDFREAVCDLVNEERSVTGAQPILLDASLSAVAQAHAVDMVERGYFSHNNPDGQSPFDRMRAAGISFRAAGENIAGGQSNPMQVMSSWMNSPGHRSNILNANFERIGIGFYQNRWVQVFAD